MIVPSTPDANRGRLVAEVLEWGETLFVAVLDAAITRSGTEESEPLPEAELRTAAEEFFQTLRGLLRVDGAPDDKPDESRGQEDS
jgi:hypothetical protein